MTTTRGVGAMVPREHGAWGQFGLPLATALVIARGSWSAWALGAGAVMAFLAHEPLLVLLGHRGERARVSQRSLALRWLALRGALAVAAAGAGLAGAGASVGVGVGIVVAMLGLAVPFVATRRERTTAGEVVLASTMAAAAVPVACAGAVPVAVAAGGWALWSLHGLLATLTVRGMVQRQKREGSARLAAAGAVVGVAALVACAVWTRALWPVAPMAAMAVGLAARPVRVTALRRVGWALVAASVVTAVGVATRV